MRTETIIDKVYLTPEEKVLWDQLVKLGWLNTPSTVSVELDRIPKSVPAIPIPSVIPIPPAVVVAPPGTVIVPPAVIAPLLSDATRFNKAFAFVCGDGIKEFGWEGDYTNDPNDPGGPTKYGIDTKDDSEDWKSLGVTHIKDLTFEQAKGIYWKRYWLGSNCPNLPDNVAEVHFNYSVNTGSSRSIKFMQSALGITVDGQFGALTQEALSKADPKKVAIGMIDHSDIFYKELANQARFSGDLRGWLNRNNALRKFIG